MLCQIELCCRYAEQHDRIVLIDTDYEKSSSFNDDLSRYFISKNERIIIKKEHIIDIISDEQDVFPEFLRDRINTYSTLPKVPFSPYLDDKAAAPISFDWGRAYNHRMLVHHQEGGGGWSVFALARFGLKAELRQEILRSLKRIGGAFDAVHVRHTDYTSNYGELIQWVQSQGLPKIFLATDNRAVVDDFRGQINGKEIFNFSENLSTDNNPIHLNKPSPDRIFQRNIECIRDLIILCFGQRLSFVSVNGFNGKKYPSGFSQLAKNLRRNEVVLRGLMEPGVRVAIRQ